MISAIVLEIVSKVKLLYYIYIIFKNIIIIREMAEEFKK
jgi:hypothetical protein